MSGLIESLRKEWYRRGTARRLRRNEWCTPYWHEAEDCRIVPCRRCPKFDARKEQCGVPYGSPLRKCVVGSIEAHLHEARGLRVLELGYGKRSLAKHVVELAGGSWTGLEPLAAPGPVALGSSGYGHAAEIPFPAATFDLVVGIQSLEHWEEPLPSMPAPRSYADCLMEVWRVLKPGGGVYFDAPIHLHGHEMFVLGDVPRIRSLFDDERWSDVVLEKWRFEHAPLAPYPTPQKEIDAWPKYLSTQACARAAASSAATVWLLAVTAKKRLSAAGSGSAAN